jgi:serine/threonine protein phosphatase PrpC
MAAGSEIGNRYAANFDVVHLDRELPLAVVADGMGGSRGSAVAGRAAVDVFVAEVVGRGAPPGPSSLRAAVAVAQARVGAAGAQLGELTGCTLTAFVGAGEEGPAAWIVQVGDSRAYRLRGGLLELLTVDHTAAWLGAVYGWYLADSAAAAQARYQLTRYIGHPDAPEPDVLSVSLRPGDVYCLCTDGLAEEVSYQRMGELLAAGPADAVAALLAEALAAGGKDNATVVVIRVG